LNPKIYEEIVENCLKVVNRKSWNDLASELGYQSGDACRSAFRREKRSREGGGDQVLSKESNCSPESESVPDYKETTEIRNDGSIVTDKLVWMSDTDSKTPDFLLKAHGYLPSTWELIQAQSTLWHGLQKGGVNKTLLYRSKIVAKPRIKPVFDEDAINKIFERLESKNFKSVPVTSKKYSNSGKSLILPISDFHLGLLSTAKVCGNEYNLEIAEKLFYQTILKTLEDVRNFDLESITFVLGNDFLNSDNLLNTTTRGTPQDSSDFWFELIDKAIELIITGTEMLRKVSKVDILCINSNHDQHSVYCIMKAVEMYYRNSKDVTVDTSPLPRKYIQFGKNLVAFSHDINVKKALEIISLEAKNTWSEIENCYLMLGHLHQAMQFERQGMLEIYRLPTISGSSRWSNDKGYLQSKKMNQSFVLDEENGIEMVLNVVVGK
jgi:hypothetical protein